MMHYRVSAVRSALCAFPFLLLIGTADIAHAKPGGKGGNKPPPVENTPLALSEEYYYFRVAGEDSCVGEDDQLRWSAEGSLAPGESFTFTPQKPACSGHPAAISVWASWDTGSLELRSIVPDADLASLDAEQVGQLIIAPEVGKTAQLCMFPAYNSDGVNYTITDQNLTSQPVHGIVFQGKSRKDWAIN